MTTNTLWLVIAVVSVVLSLALGFWPFLIVGIMVALATRHFFTAAACGFIADIAYGVPVGSLHFTFFPFTIGTFLAVILVLFGSRYFFQSDTRRL